MNEISKLLKEIMLHKKSLDEIKFFFDSNKEVYKTFKIKWLLLDPGYHKNLKYKVFHTIAAFPCFNDLNTLRNHINEFFIDCEGEVSPSKLSLLNKINPLFKDIILNATNHFPKKMTLVGRCELLRKKIYEYPTCKECNNPVAWTNSSKLLTYCSKQCADKSEHLKEKRVDTFLKLYGSKSYVTTDDHHEKTKKTMLCKYKTQHFTNREKFKNTCYKKYGFENPTQNLKIYEKIKKSLYLTKKFKNTNLYYQGTYEYYFLEQIELKGLLGEISVPEPVEYLLNGETHVYHPDYQLKMKIIEIKSTWTYNRNGKDKKLENKNEIKWDAVRKEGKEIMVLKSKKEIKDYVDKL